MNCPDCGYILTAFDKECPRCQTYKRRERSCPHCGTVNTTDAPACKKCGHPFQAQLQPPANPRTSPRVSPQADPQIPQARRPIVEVLPKAAPAGAPLQGQAQPPSSLSTPLTAEMLACRMCGNTGGQKLTALCRAGSWTTQSRGHAVGVGYDGYGHSVMVGGPTASTSHGQTALASLLLPPPRPAFQPKYIASVLVPIIGFLLSLIAYSYGPLAASLGVLMTGGLWFFALLTEGHAAATGRARHGADCARWDQAMQVWGRLFYCPRCDHVYDPQAGTAAAPTAMYTLLSAPSASLRAAHELPDDSAAVRAALLAFGVSALLLVGIWAVSVSEQRAEQEQDRQVAQVRAPLLAQFQAALPEVNAAIAAGDGAAAGDSGGDYTRIEKVSQLASDLSELKGHRDSAQQGLDDLGKYGGADGLQGDAGQVSSEIAAMLASRRSVTDELRELDRPVVLTPSHLAAPRPPVVSRPSQAPSPASVSPEDADNAGTTNTGTTGGSLPGFPSDSSGASAAPPDGTAPSQSSGADSPDGTDAAGSGAAPGTSYSITTRAGGGEPPPAASLPH